MGIYSEEAKSLLESTNVDDFYKEMLEEATNILLEGYDTDVKFHINKDFIQDPKKVKELCKVIEDDMTKPSLRNFLVNNIIIQILYCITLPISLPLAPFFGYFTVAYSFKRHDSFINKIDKAIAKLEADPSVKDQKKKIADLNESKKILNEAKVKYKTLEDKDKENLVGFVLKKFVHLY